VIGCFPSDHILVSYMYFLVYFFLFVEMNAVNHIANVDAV